ncbi:hypothetical protein [Herbidospora daliensis]|uniref:hypothetical protein n=1 Tax=Herbidospora daliensis TaxID=295585 RepID=UPI0007856A3F|nr:hypothetical protein [Herbidospora daliensis]
MSDDIVLYDNQTPALESGDYSITVDQSLSLDTNLAPALVRSFSVAGERLAFPPSAVRAVYPPDGATGDYSQTLPHVVLDGATVPWQRTLGPGTPGPWLMVLLFAGSDRPTPQVVAASTLGVTLEGAEKPADQVTVIDVPRTLLTSILPAAADLPFTAHVRSGDGPDAAVVIGSRLPPAGEPCVAHLVSMENRFSYGTLASTSGAKPVRLVSLASWKFTVLDTDHSFAARVHDLAGNSGGFRLPPTGGTAADAFLSRGLVPVRHRLRGGGKTVSWYRGPFADGPVVGGPMASSPPVRSADGLLRYAKAEGMFDLTYAAAWQLGRLLALRDDGLATTLLTWKRRRDRPVGAGAGYPLKVPSVDDAPPQEIAEWMADLTTLATVPFTYLIPDERLLPLESLRFVDVDQEWVRCLVDGAYSIGRVTAADAERDAATGPPVTPARLTGALIRSSIVSGYPGLLIDGYDAGGKRLEPVRRDTLSPNVLLVLFDGVLTRLDLHQKPEQQHFAVESGGTGKVVRALRGAAGSTDPVPLGTTGTVPLAALAAKMAAKLNVKSGFGPAAFARQMLETAERVTFTTPA